MWCKYDSTDEYFLASPQSYGTYGVFGVRDFRGADNPSGCVSNPMGQAGFCPIIAIKPDVKIMQKE